MTMLKPEEWLDEIYSALEYRRQFGKEDAWNQIELDFTNDSHSNCTVGSNLVYSMGDSLLSSLTVPDPEILLTAEHPSAVDRVPIVESVDNWLIRKMKLRQAVEDAIMNSYLFSRAILKIGYDSEFGWSPFYDIGQGNQLMGLTFTQFNKKGKRIERGSASPGMPWVSAVSPHDIVVPWGTRSIDDAPWIAHRVVRLNSYIKEDPKYRNTSRLEPRISMEAFVNSYGHVMAKEKRVSYKTASSHSESVKAVFNVLWEIHDKMSGKIFVVSQDYDKFIRDDDDALQVAGLPFVSTTLVKHPRSFWSTPQAYYLGQIQATQQDIAIQSEKQRRINNLRFLAQKGAMEEDELNKLISGDVGAVGMVDTTRPLKEVFVTFPQGNSMDFSLQSNANMAAARDAIGFSRNQLGEFDSSSRRTAREATFVKEGSETRTSRRMNTVVDLYVETIKKVNKIIFKYWKLPRHAMVGGQFVTFTGEELDGDYLYDVTLSTKRNLSRAQRKIESLSMMIQLSQIPGVDIDAMKQYIVDASGDPAFENMLLPPQQSQQKQAQGGPAQGNNLPTIPATKTGRQ